MRKTRSIFGFILLLMSAVTHGHYTNTSPGSVHACVSKTTRVVRIVGSGATAVCATGERAMHWAVNGSGFRGDWNQTILYRPGDVVLFPGFSGLGNSVSCVFLATAESTGFNPLENSNPETSNPRWRLLSPDGCSEEAPMYYDLVEAISVSVNPTGPWSLGWVSSLSADLTLFSDSDSYPDGFAW
jgi:hypothetical protein